MEIEAGIGLENEEAWAHRGREREPHARRRVLGVWTSLSSLGSSGTVMGSPTRGGAAPEAEREENGLTRGRGACFKELEFCHLFNRLTMMCQRVPSPSY